MLQQTYFSRTFAANEPEFMDLSSIIAVSGMGGLFKVIAQTKNGLLVESLADGKRTPVYSSSKVSSLSDISIYGNKEDIPLKDVFKSIRDKSGSKEIDEYKGDAEAMKKAFAGYLPDYDESRVYASDMKKVFAWYNQLLAKGLLVDAPEEKEEEKSEEKVKTPAAAAKPKTSRLKENPKAAPKTSTKGMTKTQTVRKTGA